MVLRLLFGFSFLFVLIGLVFAFFAPVGELDLRALSFFFFLGAVLCAVFGGVEWWRLRRFESNREALLGDGPRS